jgi:hypothetical protein
MQALQTDGQELYHITISWNIYAFLKP